MNVFDWAYSCAGASIGSFKRFYIYNIYIYSFILRLSLEWTDFGVALPVSDSVRLLST